MENSTMDGICSYKFWDQNLLWTADNPKLINCFQKTILTWIPCLFLWMFSIFEAHYLAKSKTKNIPISLLFFMKYAFTVLLIFLTIVDLGKTVIDGWNDVAVYIIDFVTPILKICTFVLVLVLLSYNRQFGMRTSGLLWLFWFLLTLCGAVQFISLLININDEVVPIFEFTSYIMYYLLVVSIFVMNCMVDAEPTFSEYQPVKKPCPEDSASFPSRLTFGWFDSLAWRGFKHSLGTSDLWSSKPAHTAKEIAPIFNEYWEKSRNAVEEGKIYFKKSSGHVFFNKSIKKVSILPPLCKAFGPTFLFNVMLSVLYLIMTFISPQILKLLISFTNTNEPMWKGYFYAISLFLVAVVQTFISSQSYYRINLIGFHSRTALVAQIYRKALRLSNSARKESTVGEIVNLMSSDANKINTVIFYLNMAWSAPLQIFLALYFLWEILGPSALFGLTVMLVWIPINAWIVKKETNLQQKQMKKKDERVKLITEVLNGIKILKLYAWGPSFEREILKIRDKEINVLKQARCLDGLSCFSWCCAPFLVSLLSFATFLLIDRNNVLNSETAFVSISLFNILRLPLTNIPYVISNIVEASVSVKRINKFMNLKELDSRALQHNPSAVSAYPIVIEYGTFSWDLKTKEKPTLQDINIKIQQGKLVTIVGSVGSGKSSLISALLGEMETLSGSINITGSIAYVSQQAWIQNATLQDNILFGKPLDKSFYHQVVEACALTPDFEMLPAGDQTEIGEKGINLSGGQKQRVSLARAMYSNSDIYFLDDPLSAVDSHVGKHIFENLIGPRGLMKNKTRVLVTHGITYLHEVDQIIVLKEGKVSESGTYIELSSLQGTFANLLAQHLQKEKSDEENSQGDASQRISKSISNSLANRKSSNGSFQRQHSISSQQSKSSVQSNNSQEMEQAQDNTKNNLIEAEKMETNSVQWSVYFHYLRTIGCSVVVSTVIMNVIYQFFKIGANLWLSMWSADNESDVKRINNISDQEIYLEIYGAFGLGQVVASFFCTLIPQLGGLLAARQTHNLMLHRLIRAPLSFFDTTPIGRITSRFSKDVDILDTLLASYIANGALFFFEIVGAFVVIIYSTPKFIFATVPIVLVYCLIQQFYIPTSRQLKRLESVTASPIYSQFSETLTGIQTIRAFKAQEQFITKSDSKIDENQTCCFARIVSDRWLAVRLELISNVIILFAAIFAVVKRDTISAGLVGLSITYALDITKILNWFARYISVIETNMVSVERIKEYSETPQEAAWYINDQDPPKNWPTQGVIEFQDYQVRYREDLDLVLKGLSIRINSGEKIGIVGRTGAGKTSLTLALFRIIEAADGKILIDNVDIAKIGLHILRSRLTIIPQDPVLFSGSLRMNLDPFAKFSDESIWRALEHAHLKDFVKSLPDGLLHKIAEGGDNLSVGQRQLICLARALLKKTKVLVLDEATAAVDIETDNLIQATIREQFKECTVLTIAHRLNTILDSDRIIVLDKGSIVEFDSPENLLKNQRTSFYSLAMDAGIIAV